MDKETRNEILTMVKAAVAETAQSLLAQLKSVSQIPDLAKAYVAACGEIGNVAKDANNPHFNSNYATLAAVLDTGKPVFAKYKLALLQAPGPIAGDKITLMGMILHESGQHITVNTELHIGKLTAQAAGSAITYARRYQAGAIFGLTAVDDDGNAASDTAETPPKKATAKKESPNYAEQCADLSGRIDGCTEIDQLDGLKAEVQALNDSKVADTYLAKRKALKGKK